MKLADRAVAVMSARLAGRFGRRSFIAKTAVVGSALAVTPVRYLLRPGTAYASVCGPDAECAAGWTVFCCSVNNGSNTCPPNTVPAGWWKADNSPFCGSGPRYYLDCNASCGSCGCGRNGICAPGCYDCSCRCGTESCDQRRHCCSEFRYGQCHQELPCVGPVVCRVVTCRPPWEWDSSCTTTSATANRTALHHAPCLGGAAVTAFGAVDHHGDPPHGLRARVVGMEATRSGRGYWLVAADGGIFSFGDAPFHGSTGALELNRPIVDIAATPTGAGYWLAADDGGIFAFGDAQFHGSTGARELNRPIVGIAATPSGAGYWLVASDGGVFCFGDAPFHGSLGGRQLSARITAIAATATGAGYWLVGEDGGVFSFGDAPFLGSLAADGSVFGRVVDADAAADATGYWLASS